MSDLQTNIDGIVLTEVAKSGNKKLYRYPSDWRIEGVPFSKVKKEFPDYIPEPLELLTNDYLIEEDGKIQYHYADGTPITEDELESSD